VFLSDRKQFVRAQFHYVGIPVNMNMHQFSLSKFLYGAKLGIIRELGMAESRKFVIKHYSYRHGSRTAFERRRALLSSTRVTAHASLKQRSRLCKWRYPKKFLLSSTSDISDISICFLLDVLNTYVKSNHDTQSYYSINSSVSILFLLFCGYVQVKADQNFITHRSLYFIRYKSIFIATCFSHITQFLSFIDIYFKQIVHKTHYG
jgi:hypothetical protein